MSSDPIKMEWVKKYFADEPATLRRGELFLKSCKLREFRCFYSSCEAKIDSSYGNHDNQMHLPKFCFNSTGITYANCTCVRGKFLCSHLAALMLFSVKNVSKTDVPVAKKIKRGGFVFNPIEEIYGTIDNTEVSHICNLNF